MTARRAVLGAVVALCLAVAARTAHARALPPNFQDQLVVGDLSEPTGLAFLPDGRLLVIERPGRVRLVVNGKLGVMDPLLVPDSVDATGSESGLLGVAVDPAWPQRPYVYLHYTALGLRQRVVRYRAGGDLSDGSSVFLTLDPASRFVILADVPNQDPGKNGGGLCFDAGGALLVGVGDDGVECAAQDTVSLRGVVLRLAVGAIPDGAGGPPSKSAITPLDNPWRTHPVANAGLVWAVGVHDPYRMRIDPRDGHLYLGDVGASLYEEIDELGVGALDLGWPHYEGHESRIPSCAPLDSSRVRAPIAVHEDGVPPGGRVIAGGIYLGAGCPNCDFPAPYLGDYFFADQRLGFVRRLKRTASVWDLAAPVSGQPDGLDWGTGFGSISDLAPGPDGALWYCLAGSGGSTGQVGRIAYLAPALSVGDTPPPSFTFAAPWPAPMRDRVDLAYRTATRARVELSIVDAAGRRVRTLVRGGIEEPGSHVIRWDGRSDAGVEVPAGLYVARLVVDGTVLARRIPRVR